MADTSSLLAATKFPLLRRLSVASLVAMLVTAAILVFLYRQDQLAEHEGIAAHDNEEAAIHLMRSLDDQINTLVTTSDGFDTQALRTNPDIGLFTAALDMVREHDILKLRIFNLSGVTIYSPAKSEIGEMSSHPDLLEKALSGETKHHVDFRKTFFSATGEMRDVHVALTFMPLTHAGKRIGAIEIYNDVTPVFNRIHANTIQIALVIFCAFAALYAALCLYVRRTDCAVAEWQRCIAKSEMHYRSLFKNMLDGFASCRMQYDDHGRPVDFVYLNVNEAFGRLTGLKNIEGKLASEVIPGIREQHPELFESYGRVAATGIPEVLNIDLKLLAKWFAVSVYSPEPGEGYFVTVLDDITERKSNEEQIRSLAFYDTLTQLPNRRLLNDRLGQTMAASKRNGRYGALMFMDLDNFKPLNDAHGHCVGDSLLMEVARRITSCVREVDTVARFGGDEFVVILSELDVDKTESLAQAGIVAEKIRAILAEPYMLTRKQNGKAEIAIEHHCTLSIGVVLFISYESSAEDILKWADMAMYQAKEGGRNLIRFFDSPHYL